MIVLSWIATAVKVVLQGFLFWIEFFHLLTKAIVERCMDVLLLGVSLSRPLSR